MFVNPIKNLDKSRFGINLFINDFKCVLKNENKNIFIKNKDNKDKVK